jgi:hypothetical protein
MDLEHVLAYLHDPAVETQIAVVEDEQGEIVACWAAIRVIHAEGVWIAPAHRQRVSVVRRLWKRMRRIGEGFGVSSVVTAAMDDTTKALLTRRRAVPLPQEYVLCLR